MDGTSNIAQIIIAVATLVTAVGALVTGVINAIRISNVNSNVQTIEKATNSMKDQLVASTAKASLAEGTAAGTVTGMAAGIAAGVVTGRQQVKEEDRSDRSDRSDAAVPLVGPAGPVKVEITNIPSALAGKGEKDGT